MLYTLEEVAGALRISVKTLKYLARTKKFPVTYISERGRMISDKNLTDWLGHKGLTAADIGLLPTEEKKS